MPPPSSDDEACMDLTIIIPTYNRNHTVAECVQRLRHNDAEIIVVDDGSPRPVQLQNVRILRHDRNRGRGSAVNTGLRAASYDRVLIIDDDIFAAPDMVQRLATEFSHRSHSRLALTGRVIWDPVLPCTLSMQWLAGTSPFHEIAQEDSGLLETFTTRNTMLWRPFILDNGGFDEGFPHYGFEDVELGLRLRENGLESRLFAPAVGFHHQLMKAGDLARRQLSEGMSAVYLHSKLPRYVPQVDDIEELLKNEKQTLDASAAIEKIALLEDSGLDNMPASAADLFRQLYRHHFLRGIFNGLKETGGFQARQQSMNTLAIYNQALHLENVCEFDEARRMFNLVLAREDREYWASAEYHLGCIEMQTGDKSRARNHFTECLRLDPENENARQMTS
jgi:glycosyltransferase involved in cell wall biosynthesis